MGLAGHAATELTSSGPDISVKLLPTWVNKGLPMFRHRCRATEGLRVRKLPEAIRSAGSVRRSLIGISAAVTVAAGLAVPAVVASAADGGGAAGVSGTGGPPTALAPAPGGAGHGGAGL